MVVALKHASCSPGDIIAYNDQDKLMVRRVIALGGDTVQVTEDGSVLVNGGRLEEVNTPAGFIESLGAFALDEMTPEGLKSRYFHRREDAMACLSELRGQFALRDTTLEDVFMERSGKHLT